MNQGEPQLFMNLVAVAFERFAALEPVVVRVRECEPEPNLGAYLGPQLPSTSREVSTTAGVSDAVNEAFEDGSVLLLPRWGTHVSQRGLGEHEHALLDCTPPPSCDALMAALIPASSLTARRSEGFRESLAAQWSTVCVVYGRGAVAGVHQSFEAAAIFLRPRLAMKEPIRMFRMPSRVDPSDVVDDFNLLLQKSGGTTRFGYVLRTPLDPGESLSFDRHEPKLRARKADLLNFGETRPLSELFDLPRPGINLHRDKGLLCAKRDNGAVRVLAGRDIRRDGSIVPADESSKWARVTTDRQLRIGDFVGRAILPQSDSEGFVLAEVTEDDLPAVASDHVIVMRPLRSLSEPDKLLALLYLRSPFARKVAVAFSGDAGIRTHLSTIGTLQVPQPDEALKSALFDLSQATERFDLWRSEAKALLESTFVDESAKSARARLVRAGQTLRLRADAAALLDDDAHVIRTRYPFPIAYRWRVVEANISAGEDREALDSILEAAEILVCYAANTALALARESEVRLGYRINIKQTYASGRGGPGFGDWLAVLEEVRDGRSCRNLPDGHPLGSLSAILGTTTAQISVRRLLDLRNDQAHGRRIDSVDLPRVLASAREDLASLMISARVLADMPLLHVASFQWDTLVSRGSIRYRELMGDHPVVPTRIMDHETNDVEADSLYLLDEQRAMHLLRPYLIGRRCPTCKNWSTFHVDRVPDGKPSLKSLEHGHTVEDISITEPLRHVDLL